MFGLLKRWAKLTPDQQEHEVERMKRDGKAAIERARTKVRPEPKVHDYTDRGWGHDYSFDPKENGMKGSIVGWGHGIKEGDKLLLKSKTNRTGSTMYKVDSISYYNDPPDMFSAQVSFVPRHYCPGCKLTFEDGRPTDKIEDCPNKCNEKQTQGKENTQ